MFFTWPGPLAISRIPKGTRCRRRVSVLLGAGRHSWEECDDEDQLDSRQNSRTPIPCVCDRLRVIQREAELGRRLGAAEASSLHKKQKDEVLNNGYKSLGIRYKS